MRAVLVQIIENNSEGKIDRAKLQQRLDVPTANAARVRWNRFKKKLMEEDGVATVCRITHRTHSIN